MLLKLEENLEIFFDMRVSANFQTSLAVSVALKLEAAQLALVVDFVA